MTNHSTAPCAKTQHGTQHGNISSARENTVPEVVRDKQMEHCPILPKLRERQKKTHMRLNISGNQNRQTK